MLADNHLTNEMEFFLVCALNKIFNPVWNIDGSIIQDAEIEMLF